MPNLSRQTVQVDTGSVAYAIAEEVTSRSISITIASNPNRCSVIVFATRNGGAISSIVRGGLSYTRAVKSASYDGNWTEIWYCVNPTVGTSNAVVTFASKTGNNAVILGHVGLYNVDQADPVDVTSTKTGDSNFTHTFTVTESNCVAVDGQHNTKDSQSNPSAGQTLIYRRYETDSAGISYETDIDAGSESMGWSFSTGSDAYSHAVAVFQGHVPTGGGFIFNML